MKLENLPRQSQHTDIHGIRWRGRHISPTGPSTRQRHTQRSQTVSSGMRQTLGKTDNKLTQNLEKTENRINTKPRKDRKQKLKQNLGKTENRN